MRAGTEDGGLGTREHIRLRPAGADREAGQRHDRARLRKAVANGAAVLLILAALGFGYALTVGGWRPVVLLSGSMAPAAPAGSLVLTVPTEAHEVRVGDVIVIYPPHLDKPVTHRVVALEPRAGGVLATTQGDANPVQDPEAASLSGSVPRVILVVPRLGQWLLRLGPIGAICLAVSGFAATELIRMAKRASTSWNASR